MQLFAGELTNQNREHYKVNDNSHLYSYNKKEHKVKSLLTLLFSHPTNAVELWVIPDIEDTAL